MIKHIKLVIAGAAIVALAIGLLVGFSSKENKNDDALVTASASAAYGTATDYSTTTHTTTLYQPEGVSKSGKGSYEYAGKSSGKLAKGSKCEWKYVNDTHIICGEYTRSLSSSSTTIRFRFIFYFFFYLFICTWYSVVLWKILRHDEHAYYH
jgi:hypothetical protein